MSILIGVQTACQGYQQTTNVLIKAVLGHFGHGHFGHVSSGLDISARDILARENAEVDVSATTIIFGFGMCAYINV